MGETDEAAVRRLVETFYARVRRDPLLAPVFHRAIGEGEAEWAHHIARISDFWSTMMLGAGSYRGNPFAKHFALPEELTPAMFERWLALFGETCAEVLPPDAARAFRARAGRIAQSFQAGLFALRPAS